jgi:hypothetical protein
VIIALWILSEFGDLGDFLTLVYAGNGSLISEISVVMILQAPSIIE